MFEDQRECSFHPMINHNSAKIVMERSQMQSEYENSIRGYSNKGKMNTKFNDLYEDAKKRKER